MIHRLLLLCLLLWMSLPAAGQSVPDPAIGPLKQKISQLETRIIELERLARKPDSGGVVLFLFGVFCALWAQNTGRNPWLWFFVGFAGSIVTVIILLMKNSSDRRHRLLRGKAESTSFQPS
jgi:hypothetical protein